MGQGGKVGKHKQGSVHAGAWVEPNLFRKRADEAQRFPPLRVRPGQNSIT
jgi:hypothetical protein